MELGVPSPHNLSPTGIMHLRLKDCPTPTGPVPSPTGICIAGQILVARFVDEI